MVSYEYIREDKIAVFLETGFGKRKIRTGSINLVDTENKLWQYVTSDGFSRSEAMKLKAVKESLENDE